MMSDNYTPDDLTQRGLEEMAYERDLAAQTARAEAAEAEVARLTADNAALRAQLAKFEAGQFDIQQKRGGRWVNLMRHNWRPTPPQE